VLDEAHDIRNKSTKQYEAISALQAQHRWCLTGTPIQNSLEDLGALVSFLRVPIMEESTNFRKYIANIGKSPSADSFSNLRLLLGSICLRRTRDILDMSTPVTEIRQIQFSVTERAEYRLIEQSCRQAIDMAVSGRRRALVNHTVLESLLKLRLFCNNGSNEQAFGVFSDGLPSDPYEAFTYLQQIDQADCAYCSCSVYFVDGTHDSGGAKLTACPHLICVSCIGRYQMELEQQRKGNKNYCPICRKCDRSNYAERTVERPQENSLGKSQNYNMQLQHQYPMFSDRSYPSKLLALLEDLKNLRNGEKSIVFSSWKKTLNIAARLLQNTGIHFNRIDGSLTLSERKKVLADFRSNGGATVLLMTLGTGAVGLNLAVASRIYLLEPQWNPSIENQAIGRALRIGQTSQVTVIRYIMKSTVEEV